MKTLRVKMLGDFVISTEDTQISDRDNRTKKIWILLAYLIYHRHRVIFQDELMNLLWSEGEKRNNPNGALKTTFHRVRAMLDSLWPHAGHELILCQNGGYVWNKEIPIEIDIEEFEKLSHKGIAVEDKEQVEKDFEALKLYRGDFLNSISSEAWVIPIAAYYHNCYIQSLLRVIPVLMEGEEYSKVAEICRSASVVEPYHEEIHCWLMKALLFMGNKKDAANVYENFSETLFANFGIMPPEEMRKLHHESIRTNNDQSVPFDVIQKQLQEEDYRAGALICEYDFFRVLYRSMARSMARSGIAAHVALLTVGERRGCEMTRRKMKCAMENLEDQIRLSLRRGDTAAQCSVSQYIVMLPQANYENSCMVCERIIKAFYRKHPHTDADVQFAVYPLQPDEKEFRLNI